MPAFGSSTASALPDLDEPEAQAVRRREVEIEPVRVEVVRHVEVGPAVAVDVREGRAEPVVEPVRLEPGRAPDLAEARVPTTRPDVEIEQVTHCTVIRREARLRAGQRVVDVGVARDEEVEAPVAVHVRDGRARVPAGRVDPRRLRALRERAVAVVPEDGVVGVPARVVPGGGDDEVGRAVAVEVARDAAAAAHRETRARLSRDVHEPAVHVVEQAAPREPATGGVRGDVGVRVRVHDVEVEPAVAVVVEPAEAAAHHRRLVAGHAEAERALADVEPDAPRDVLQGEWRRDGGDGGAPRRAAAHAR